MNSQKLNDPIFHVGEVQDLAAYLLHELISHLTSISAGLDMRVETWAEVAPLMRKSRDTLLSHVNVMRFVMTHPQESSSTGWSYVTHYGNILGVDVRGATQGATSWQAGLILWGLKQFAYKTGASITMTEEGMDIQGVGFMLDEGNTQVLLGQEVCTNPRQSLSRYLHLVVKALGRCLKLEHTSEHLWQITWPQVKL